MLTVRQTLCCFFYAHTVLLIWKADKVFALVFGLYVYLLNMRIWLPLVIATNEMTFPSFQNTIFSFSRKFFVNSVAILSHLKGKKHTQGRIMICPLPSLFISHTEILWLLSTEWRLLLCRGKRSNNCFWKPPRFGAYFLTLCNNQHNSLLTEWQPHLMLISRLVNGNILKDSQQLRGPRD